MTACGGTSSRWAITASAQRRRFRVSTGSCAPSARRSSRAWCSTRSRRARRSTACPASSPMPFRWTVNPYRGCAHACVYCLAGPTRVLLADGRTRPIAELRVGDVVLGTEQVDGVPPLRAHAGARALVHPQARLRRAPRGWHRARHQRRAPLPHRARVAARERRVVPRRAPPPPAARVAVARARTVRSRSSGRAGRVALGRVPPRLPLRPRARRRARLPVGAPGAGGARSRPPPAGRSPARTDHRRDGARPHRPRHPARLRSRRRRSTASRACPVRQARCGTRGVG